jgi:hypothetical protein
MYRNSRRRRRRRRRGNGSCVLQWVRLLFILIGILMLSAERHLLDRDQATNGRTGSDQLGNRELSE